MASIVGKFTLTRLEIDKPLQMHVPYGAVLLKSNLVWTQDGTIEIYYRVMAGYSAMQFKYILIKPLNSIYEESGLDFIGIASCNVIELEEYAQSIIEKISHLQKSLSYKNRRNKGDFFMPIEVKKMPVIKGELAVFEIRNHPGPGIMQL